MLSRSFCLLEPRVHSSREFFHSSLAPPVGSIRRLRKRFKRQGTTDTAPGLMSSHVTGHPTLEWVRVGLLARRKGSNFPAEAHKRCTWPCDSHWKWQSNPLKRSALGEQSKLNGPRDTHNSTAAFAKPVARGGAPAETYTLRKARTPLAPPQIYPEKSQEAARLPLIVRPISYIMLTTKSG